MWSRSTVDSGIVLAVHTLSSDHSQPSPDGWTNDGPATLPAYYEHCPFAQRHPYRGLVPDFLEVFFLPSTGKGTCSLSSACLPTYCPPSPARLDLASRLPADPFRSPPPRGHTRPLLFYTGTPPSIFFIETGCFRPAHNHRHHSFLKGSRPAHDSPPHPRIPLTATRRTLSGIAGREASWSAIFGLCRFRLLTLE